MHVQAQFGVRRIYESNSVAAAYTVMDVVIRPNAQLAEGAEIEITGAFACACVCVYMHMHEYLWANVCCDPACSASRM
jgi:hypothetical protein